MTYYIILLLNGNVVDLLHNDNSTAWFEHMVEFYGKRRIAYPDTCGYDEVKTFSGEK